MIIKTPSKISEMFSKLDNLNKTVEVLESKIDELFPKRKN